MADFIVHDTTTGVIIRYGSCQSSDVALQASGTNENVLAVSYQPGTVVNGVLVPLSPAAADAQIKADRKAHIAELIAEKKMWASIK